MSWFTGIMTYVIIWWVVLLMVLPWGVRIPDEQEPGHATSAPRNPMMWRKALATTVIAAVIWAGVYWLVESDLVSVRGP